MKIKVFLLRRSLLTALVCLIAAAGIFYVVNFPPAVGAAADPSVLAYTVW